MKKFMKALALALALCMVLSVSAFAHSATGDTATQEVAVRVELADSTSTEQVALLIVDTDVTDVASVTEGQIYYIDQKPATAGVATFTAPIAADEEKVKVYVGSSSISGSGALCLGEVAIKETKNIVISTAATNKKVININETTADGKTITRPGAALLVNFKNVPVDKMIWALKSGTDYVYSTKIELAGSEYASLAGDTWFSGVFSSARLAELGINTIYDVAALFHGTDGTTYYINIDKVVADNDMVKAN